MPLWILRHFWSKWHVIRNTKCGCWGDWHGLLWVWSSVPRFGAAGGGSQLRGAFCKRTARSLNARFRVWGGCDAWWRDCLPVLVSGWMLAAAVVTFKFWFSMSRWPDWISIFFNLVHHTIVSPRKLLNLWSCLIGLASPTCVSRQERALFFWRTTTWSTSISTSFRLGPLLDPRAIHQDLHLGA